jgi:hypothetical protein
MFIPGSQNIKSGLKPLFNDIFGVYAANSQCGTDRETPLWLPGHLSPTGGQLAPNN